MDMDVVVAGIASQGARKDVYFGGLHRLCFGTSHGSCCKPVFGARCRAGGALYEVAAVAGFECLCFS